MKKLSLAIFIAASLSNSIAFAKTENSYFGVDILRSKLKFYERYTNDSTPQPLNRRPSFSSDTMGFGLYYNYAVNMNRFFLAPGIFYEHSNAKAQGTGTRSLQKVEIANRFGVKMDMGFDITNNIAPYITGGYSGLSYKTTEYFTDDVAIYSQGHASGVKGDLFYGAGLKVDVNKLLSIRAEYNIQNFLLKNNTDGALNGLSSRYRTRFDVLKVGVAYRF